MYHSLTQVWCISEEGNTLGLDKKKTTAVGSASYCFGAFTILVLILSLRKLRGFLLYVFSEKNSVSLVSCDVLMLYCCTFYSLSKDPNIILA